MTSVISAGNIVEVSVNVQEPPVGQQAPTDPLFLEGRKKLAGLLLDVAKTTEKRFGEPWGLVAMDMAANQKSAAQVTIDWSEGEKIFHKKRVSPN